MVASMKSLLFLLSVQSSLTKCSKHFELPVVHFNDFHARFEEVMNTSCAKRCTDSDVCIGGLARLSTVLQNLKVEKPDSIILNAGDNFQGTLWYNIFKWNVTQYFLNLLPTDAITLGNHEFDDKISGVVPFLKALKAPVIVSNIDDSLEPDIQGLYNKSVVIERNGKKIGIVGVILSTTNQISSTGNLTFLDESASVNAEADRLVKEEGVFTVIVLSHCGYTIDQAIARNATSKIGLIVGGHSHTFLYTGNNPPGPDTPTGDYPTIVERSDNRKVLVVQASAYTKYVGNLTVYYNQDGDVDSWDGAPIFLDHSIEPDATITYLLAPWKEIVDAKATVVVGRSLVTLDSKCYDRECLLGNFVTDAMVYSYLDEAEEGAWTYAAIAFMNAGGLRAEIPAGNVTYEDVASADPFEDTIDVGELQGKHIKALLESTTRSYYYGRIYSSVSLLQVSGLKVVYNLSQPEGSRIESVKVRCRECLVPVYEDLDLEKYYRVVVSSYLVAGGDGYTIISENLVNHTAGRADIDVLVEYFRARSPMYEEIEGRITFVGTTNVTMKYQNLV